MLELSKCHELLNFIYVCITGYNGMKHAITSYRRYNQSQKHNVHVSIKHRLSTQLRVKGLTLREQGSTLWEEVRKKTTRK